MIPESLHLQLHQVGSIPFAEFMQFALYSPEFGYYSNPNVKFGRMGDFITAPELTPLFAKTLANQCQQILSVLSGPSILEFGAGSGQLCVDLLQQLEALNCLPDAYYILEVSADLHRRQQQLVSKQIPHLQDKVHWLNHWPNSPIKGILLANEVLDAMPIHRFLHYDGKFYESVIALDEKEQLIEQFKPCSNPLLERYLSTHCSDLPTPYLSEVNLFIDSWVAEAARHVHEGVFIILDYGFPRAEYYHPDRYQGTLMCHYQHQTHPNPFIHIGQQDITAHVDFTHIAEAAVEAGWHVAGYTNQAAFLVSNGLLHFLDEINTPRERFNALQAVKQLTEPSEMGELIKVIALTKHLDIALKGFELQDKRVTL